MAACDLIGIPDEAIDEVFCRLPIDAVVRTSVLSRRWRHRWRSIPDLNLDFWRIDPVVATDVLRQHSGCLRLFKATRLYGSVNDDPSAVRSWIETLAARSASTLRVLDIGDDLGTQCKFHLLALSRCFPHLTHLRLDGCSLDVLPASDSDDFSPFPSLNFLELINVDSSSNVYSIKALSLFVPLSLSLKTLTLINSSPAGCLSCDLYSIALNCPGLIHLTISGHGLCCNPLRDPELSAAAFPALKALHLSDIQFDDIFSAFVPACPSLETLLVTHSWSRQNQTVAVFCAGHFPNLLRLNLKDSSLLLLSESKVRTMPGKSTGQFSQFLSASPLLEQLILVNPLCWREGLNIAGMNLKELYIHNVNYIDNFTITAAPVLKKASIDVDICWGTASYEASRYDNFMKILGAMHSIEELHLSYQTLSVW